jgi:hypothetical protein
MPIPKKSTSSATTLKIGNVEIEIGKKYILDHKFDGSAPDGLKSIKATRLPFENNTIKDCVGFDDMTELYDTGFAFNSPCLSQYTQVEKDELIPQYIKHIKEPYEKVKSVSLSNAENSEFYKKYRYDLYVNQEFDTSNIHQLFDLFNAILQGYVCLKDEINPYYREPAQFIISNPTELKNKQKDGLKKRLATYEKLSLMDRDKLDLVLEYVGRDNPSKIDIEDLKMMYFEVINDKDKGLDFAERFINASSKYETEAGKMEMEYFSAATRLYKANKIKKDKKGFSTVSGDVFLGNTMQDIATHCLNVSSKQHEVIKELIDEI